MEKLEAGKSNSQPLNTLTYVPNIKTHFVVDLIAQSQCLKLKLLHPVDISEIKGKFSIIFMREFLEKENRLVIDQTQYNSPKIREDIKGFVEEFACVYPVLNKLNTYFKLLRENEPFYIAFYRRFDKIETHKAIKMLQSLETGEPFDKIWSDSMKMFGNIFSDYDVNIFDGTTKTKIGESDKTIRICRFCKKKSTETTFRKKAHAISEALGNKTIILHEECDVCNEKFGRGIEKAIFNYCRVYLLMTGVKGKDGVSALKGKGFKLKNEGDIFLEMAMANRPNEGIFPMIYNLDTNEIVSEQDVYRALCKFAIGIVENQHLPDLDETIDWVNGDKTRIKLPKIAQKIDPKLNYGHPFIVLYVRKSNDESLPKFVAELRVSILRLVFILPTVESQKIKFSDDVAFERFWKHFNYYSDEENWSFVDLSDEKRKPIRYLLNFTLENKNEQID